MSVAPTKSEISANPSKMGVTVAASGKELEADIQKKMKLWGVIQAFNNGRMPDNKQIDKALGYAIDHSPVDLSKLSPEGKVLIDDSRDILETLRAIVREKNDDELFQNAVWQSYAGDPSRAKQNGVVPVSKADAKKDVDQAAAHLRVLITLFITNSEFRKILSDFGIVGRDVFATAAAKAADKARPTQEQLDQVDQEAPSKQWIGADGQKLGPNETPDVAIKGPDGAEVRYNPKDAPSDAQVTDTQGNTRSAGQAYNEAQQAKNDLVNKKEELKSEAKNQASAHGKDLANQRDPNASLSEQKEQLKGAAQNKADQASSQADRNTPNVDRDQAENEARNKAQQLKEKIPEKHREAASDAINTTKDILHDALPEERREQFIYRLKKVVVEAQEHKDYMEAMTWLLDTLENYKGHAQHVTGKGVDAAKDFKSDPAISNATLGFRTLLERFANGKSMDGMVKALDQIYTDVDNDPELKGYFSKLNDYVHRLLLEPGWILDEEAEQEGRQLQEGGKKFFSDKYKGHQEHLFDEIQNWFTALGDDPLNVRLGEDVKRLTKDLLFNEEGNLTFKGRLWKDVKDVILPSFIRQIGYVPIPRAEYSDDSIDVVIENLILSGPNLFPNLISIRADNSFTFSPFPSITKHVDTHHHKMQLSGSGIQADIRDVNFAFRRKTGWPKISDHGLADVVVAGKGISFDVEIESVPNNRNKVFKINHVKVDIDTLKFSLRDTKHDLLYKFIKSTASGIIKKAIQAAMIAAIRSALDSVEDQLCQVRNTMQDAKHDDQQTRAEALKQLYARKKEKAEENKEKAKAKAEERHSEFRLVTDRDDQLNPDLTHDSKKSIASRQYKTEDLAASGDSWHSPAFDLTDSAHPAVTGEHHHAAQHGAGAKNVASNAVDAARGHTTTQTQGH